MANIGQIIRIAREQILFVMRDGRVFPTYGLNQLLQEGRLAIRPLRITDNLVYLNVPLVWTREDDFRTERERIDIAKSLVINGLESMEFLIEEKLRWHPEYRFVMDPEPYSFSEVTEMPLTAAQSMRITTNIHVERI